VNPYRPVAPVVVAVLAAFAGALVLSAALIIAAAIQVEPEAALVDRWEISVTGPATIGDPIRLDGLIQCSAAALDANPVVQFSGSVRLAVETGAEWEISRFQLPAQPIVSSCDSTGEPGSFEWAWSDQFADALTRLVDQPTRVQAVISVTASDDGWRAAETQSESFVLNPAD
jgi:hypothetical protein